MDTINAFDIIVTFRKKIALHSKGIDPVQINFIVEDTSDSHGLKRITEVYILPMHQNSEKEIISYADKLFSDKYRTVFS